MQAYERRSCAFKQKVFEKVNPFCVLFTTEIKQPNDAIPPQFSKNSRVIPLCRCRSFSPWEAVGDAGSAGQANASRKLRGGGGFAVLL